MDRDFLFITTSLSQVCRNIFFRLVDNFSHRSLAIPFQTTIFGRILIKQ